MASFLDEILPQGHVPVFDTKTGELRSMPEEEYKNSGDDVRFQTPDEQKKYYEQEKYGNQELRTGVEGALRAGTLGLSDVVQPALGIASPGELKGREETNPGSATVGEITGTVASLAIPGVDEVSGPALVAKIGKEAELAAGATTVAGRLSAKAAAGGLEGLLYGAGNTVSDQALGDPDLNAQKVVAHFGLGALLGSGGGLLAGGLDEATAPITKKLAESLDKAPSTLREFSTNRGLKALGGITSDIKNINPLDREGLFKTALDNGYLEGAPDAIDVLKKVEPDLAGASKVVGNELTIPALADGTITPTTKPEEAEKLFSAARKEQGQAEGEILANADKAGAQFDYAKPIVRILDLQKTLDPTAKRVGKSFIGDVLGDLSEANQQGGGFELLHKIRANLDDSIAYDSASGAKLGMRLRKQVVGILRDEIDSQLGSQVGSDIAQDYLDNKRIYGLLVNAEEASSKGVATKQVIGDLIDQAKIGTDQYKSPASDLYKQLSQIHSLASAGSNREIGGAAFSLRDRLASMVGSGIGAMTGGVLGGPIGAAAGYVGGGIASKIVRERGAAIVARMASKIAESPVLKTVADAFAGTLRKSIGMFGPYGPALANALAQNPETALATHMALSDMDPGYRKVASVAQMPTETHVATELALNRAHDLAKFQHVIALQDTDKQKLVKQAVKGGKAPVVGINTSDFGAKTTKKASEDAHGQRVKEVLALANDPKALADRISNNIGDIGARHPGMVTSLTKVASNALNFLVSKHQGPPPSAFLAPNWSPSRGEISKFNRYLDIVQDPQRALKQVAEGGIAPETMDTMRNVFPELLEDYRQEILQKLAEKPDLSYGQRVQLAMFLGADIDGTMTAKSIQGAQMTYAALSATQGPGAGPTPAKAGKLTLASRSKTDLQATQDRES